MSSGGEPLHLGCIAHSGMVQSIAGLEGWQRTQNGALSDIRREVTGLRTWMMTTLATAVLSLALLIAQMAVK